MIKIAALIRLILEINNLVDLLNWIPNAEERNLEFVEDPNICNVEKLASVRQRWDSNSILTNRSTNSQFVELVERNSPSIFKNVFKKN